MNGVKFQYFCLSHHWIWMIHNGEQDGNGTFFLKLDLSASPIKSCNIETV